MKKILRKTALTRTLFFLTADIVLISLAVWLAFILRFDGTIPERFLPSFCNLLILALVFHIPIFYFWGLYSFSWSYVSAKELVSLITGSFFAFLLASLAIYMFFGDFSGFSQFPRSVLIISYFLVVLLAGALRFSKRIYLQSIRRDIGKKEKERILIIGAGDAGEQILRNIQGLLASPYLPVGFIDDSPFKKGTFIHGVKVLGSVDEIPQIAPKSRIEGAIIAFPSAQRERVKKAAENCRKAGIQNIKILPPLNEIVNGKVSFADIKDFKVEDLLNRPFVLPDFEKVVSFIAGKTILITGAAGSIGAEIARQVAGFNPSLLVLLDQDETGIFNIEKEIKETYSNAVPVIADITDKNKVENVFEKYKPDIVFHAAAYKHVPLMEKEPEEAVKNNIFGTLAVARAAMDCSAEKFVFISTDKAINPTSVMGATKRVGEMICQNLNQKGRTKFISVRFGNVLDSRGSVIPLFKEQIKKRGSVTVTAEEMKRYFMLIPEAVGLVLQASQMGQGGEVFVLDMGSPVRIIDLARSLIRLLGLEPDKDIPIVFTGPRPGEKPFEEILTAEEGIEATKSRSIFRAKLSFVEEEQLNRGLEKLKFLAKQNKSLEISNVLRELVPFFNK